MTQSGTIGSQVPRAIAMMAFSIALVAVLALGFLNTEPLTALTGQNDKTLHVAAFFVPGALGALIWPALPICLFLIACAALLELAQHLGPWHEAGLEDIVASGVGAALGVGSVVLMRRLGTRYGRSA